MLTRDEIIRIARAVGLLFYTFDKDRQITRQLSAVTYDEFEAEINRIYQSGCNAGLKEAAEISDRIAGNYKDFDRYHRRAAGMIGAEIRARIKEGA